MFMFSLHKSTHQAARECRLTRHPILSASHKKLGYSPWNPDYVHELNLQTVTAELNTKNRYCVGMMLTMKF